jgi:hypothetical protein
MKTLRNHPASNTVTMVRTKVPQHTIKYKPTRRHVSIGVGTGLFFPMFFYPFNAFAESIEDRVVEDEKKIVEYGMRLSAQGNNEVSEGIAKELGVLETKIVEVQEMNNKNDADAEQRLDEIDAEYEVLETILMESD